MKKLIYLDNSATTPLDKEVFKAMKPYFSNKFGNASTLYGLGLESRMAIEKAREQIAKAINAEPEEIYFTSGGTESNNLIIKNFDSVLTSTIEHPAVLNTCRLRKNCEIVSVDKKGYVNLEELKQKLNSKKINLVTIMHSNNEIGAIQQIEKIHKLCQEKNIPLHTDAVQSFGKVELDTKNFEMLSLSAHKIYGPKGVGAVYINKKVKIKPLLIGGGQESGLRSGTENVPGIAGLGKATEMAIKNMEKDNLRISKLRDYLKNRVLKEIKDSWVNGGNNRLSGNIHFGFKGIEGEALILMLDEYGICASTGSACSSKSLKSSHVLSAIGLKPEDSHGSLRITIGKQNTKQEIDYVCEVLPKIVKKLREISSEYKG
ncbi:aminotransferase class V-fold PLP-dependent enzyme [Candidatus Woesearchaeota archaeon]|nr:aminotransferase class V-fold PLP-dependent enzyme [Candidatus Woesearchaeota archaeon]